ncbi:hypothetical protein H4R18_001629 [Coemansia javaensis]|uniref:Uncharacterized protein n=1 Tax=Coemansia javaensis TaxID=2761396 RepID=A0A9W8HD75_9FUNG|nr:hypothetical protein H4R18_001629 [Coemansia javaensis]
MDRYNSFCKLVLISNTAAVTAATCFETDANKQVDLSRYTIEFSDKGSKSFYAGPTRSVKIHEAFNRASFTNNIAVVTFDPIKIPELEKVDVVSSPGTWASKRLVYRNMNPDGNWYNFNVADLQPVAAGDCEGASELYKNNPGDYHCSTQQVYPEYAPNCPWPYRTLIGFSFDAVGQIAFYSHSAKQDITNLCDKAIIYDYYLNIANYIPWINQQINPGVKPTTTSTTTTLTVTTNVVSGAHATVTAPSTDTTTTTSTTSSTTTSTTTATQTATLTSATTVSTTSTLEVTATVFSVIGDNSVCPPVTPCLEAGGPVTVKQTQTQTATTTVTYMNFGATGVIVAGGQTQSKYVSTILITSVKTAVTATVTVTSGQPSSTTTVTVLATGPAGSQKPATTVVQTVTAPSGSPSSHPPTNPNQNLVTAAIIVAVLLLVVMCIAIWMYCRAKSKPKRPATDFPYYPYAAPIHPPAYSDNGWRMDEKSYGRQGEPGRQSRYNARGSYVGYNSFCKPVVVSSTAAVAAATCFETDANKQVNLTRYAVQFSDMGSKSFYSGPVRSVKIHEAFNAASFTNNIAILTFDNINVPGSEKLDVISSPSAWASKRLVYRNMAGSGNWYNFNVADLQPGAAGECEGASELFKSNPGDYHCSTQQMYPEYAPNCPWPYRTLIGFNAESAGQVGFYSHSAKQNVTDLCDKAVIYDYYLNIANYIPWINQQINPGVTVATASGQPAAPSNQTYKMAEPQYQSEKNMTVYTYYGYAINVLYPTIPQGPAVKAEVPKPQVLPSAKDESPMPMASQTATTLTTTTTVSAQPTTTSTTTTQTVTTNVVSGAKATVTAPSTATITTTSTTSSTTTSTTTATQTTTSKSTATASTTSTLTVTATVFSAVGGNSMCPPITPCLQAGRPTTVRQTKTQTSTTTVTYMNFGATGVVATGGRQQSTYVSTVTITTVKKADTATATVTNARPSSTTTVVIVNQKPSSTNKPATTVTHTATGDSTSAPAPEAENSNQTLVIAVAAVAVLLLLAVCIAIWMYCRGKSKPKGPVTDFPYHSYATPGYVPDYYN